MSTITEAPAALQAAAQFTPAELAAAQAELDAIRGTGNGEQATEPAPEPEALSFEDRVAILREQFANEEIDDETFDRELRILAADRAIQKALANPAALLAHMLPNDRPRFRGGLPYARVVASIGAFCEMYLHYREED